MKKHLSLFLLLITLCCLSCSSDDNHSPVPPILTNNQIVGKWVIYKAIYTNSPDTIHYDINGLCGREVLEFFTDKTVNQDLYIDDNCNNGAGSAFEWWKVGNTFRMGYHESDAVKVLTVSGSKLYLDGWADWGYRKYYLKVN